VTSSQEIGALEAGLKTLQAAETSRFGNNIIPERLFFECARGETSVGLSVYNHETPSEYLTRKNQQAYTGQKSTGRPKVRYLPLPLSLPAC
jgi:hypothetical protein